MAAIEYRGLNAVTNFDLSRYIKWLKPNNNKDDENNMTDINLLDDVTPNCAINGPNTNQELEFNFFHNQKLLNNINTGDEAPLVPPRPASATSALELLLQSSKFKEMVEMTSVTNLSTPLESELSQCAFPEDIQTYFEYEDSSSNRYGELGDDIMFNELNSFVPMFNFDGFEDAEIS